MSALLTPEIITVNVNGTGGSNGTGVPSRTIDIAMMVFSAATVSKITIWDDLAETGAAGPVDVTADPVLVVELRAGETYSPPIGPDEVFRFQRGVFLLVDSLANDTFCGFYGV